MTATAEPATIEAALARAAEILSDATDVALACHVNPDPDALGSMLGLAGYLHARGVTVRCSWGQQPLEVPRWARELAGRDLLVEPKAFPEAPAVMVALDTAAPDRLGGLAGNAKRARQSIVIDHHRTNPGFGTVLVIDPDASSTCELVFRLCERMGGRLPDGAAECLYAGLLTDTGRFQYQAATPHTLRVAAELRSHRFDHTRLGQILFEDNSVGYLRVLGVALDRLVHVPQANLLWTYLTQSDLADAGVAPPDTDDLIDVVRTAREADVTCILKQQRDGRFKVSVRSKGATDVGSAAAGFGGGGHRLAAGYTSDAGPEESVEALIEALRNGAPGG
jgi:bifunctional oligoribonuclease and PAP phosphatase NrnA